MWTWMLTPLGQPQLLCFLSPCPPAMQPEQEQTIAETLEFIGCLGSKLYLMFY